MVQAACVDIMLARRAGGPGGAVRLVVHDAIMLIWTMTGTTAATIATGTRINTTAVTTTTATIVTDAAMAVGAPFRAAPDAAPQPLPASASE
jgi:hypothetical protein